MARGGDGSPSPQHEAERERNVRRGSLFVLLLALVLFACRAGIGTTDPVADATPSQQTTTKVYVAPEGWSFRYPASWDRVEGSFVQETETGKTITFESEATTDTELEQWIASEIARKLAATEADNRLREALSVTEENGLTVYRYAIMSRMETRETVLRTTVFFDGSRRYALYVAMPPVTEAEYALAVGSFSVAR